MFKKVYLFGTVVFVLLAGKSICGASEMLQTTDFQSGVSLPWHITESEDRNAYDFVENGQYVVHMDYPGENNWDVQIRHRQISLVKGEQYVVKFEVVAQKSCKIYAKIGDQGEPYYEAWNNRWTAYDLKANEILEVKESFTSEKDIVQAEFAFHLGGKNAAPVPYEINFISMSLDAVCIHATPRVTEPEKMIKVNQTGYLPNSTKKATLRFKDDSHSTPIKWELKNEAGVAVDKGETIPFGLDKASGDYVHTIDFSNYRVEGKGYTLVTEFGGTSYGFDISRSIYSKMKYDALKYFYHARSGIEIKMPYCVESAWARLAGHKLDSALLEPGSTFEGPEKVDATGGWYDGADHGKYVVHGGLALWLLQNQYENAEIKNKNEYLKDGSLNIPESGNKINDLLDESKWEMDWMLNMQIPKGYEKEGMAVYKVGDEKWTGMGTAPSQDLQKRIYYEPTTAATLNLAACGAQAARIWKDIDAEYSIKCLDAAKKAYTAAKANPSILAHYGPEIGSVTYGDDYVADDFYWAACELYLTTGETEYLEELKAYDKAFSIPNDLTGEIKGFDGGFNWNSTTALGTISLAMLKPNEFHEAVDSIKKTADGYLEIQKKEGYGVPISEGTFTSYISPDGEKVTGYPCNSNQYIGSKSIILAYAYDLSKEDKYYEGITELLDYLLGRNPNNKSYVSGYGEKPLQNPHHRFFCKQADENFPSVPPGFLTSGPNSGCEDSWAADLKILKTPPQKCYFDHIESWATNIVDINLNATLAWITAYVDGLNSYIMEEDLDGDGFITMSDVMKIAKCFNSKVGDENYNEKCDINKDSAINMIDVVRIAKVFGQNR